MSGGGETVPRRMSNSPHFSKLFKREVKKPWVARRRHSQTARPSCKNQYYYLFILTKWRIRETSTLRRRNADFVGNKTKQFG